MKYYIEITLIKNTELTVNQLWTRLYTQVHLAFVEHKDSQGHTPFGVAFPQYRYHQEKKLGSLGGKLRIFAVTESLLIDLNLTKWLAGLEDMIHYTGIKPVPQVTTFATYQRKQYKTSAERLANHRLKHHNDMTFEQAVIYYTPRLKISDLPYIQLKSLTNQQMFKLFIKKSEVREAVAGNFSSYGLSAAVSVPDF
ncbi:type I-F CRISPR-associated endoribonuclease Cas6/Csy4 [Utexia brackfieldae]|uniref:type I-F CRISPR-associated endoribonuclease Cas6/Csy4 n=1 Tax=Utexia brackfieldae TaxID=3074108 RepID=UPI00370D753B